MAPSCATSAGGAQAPVPATHRLPAQPRTISERPSRVSTADVQQQPVPVADSILQHKDQARAEVRPQSCTAATAATVHAGCCTSPSRGRPIIGHLQLR